MSCVVIFPCSSRILLSVIPHAAVRILQWQWRLFEKLEWRATTRWRQFDDTSTYRDVTDGQMDRRLTACSACEMVLLMLMTCCCMHHISGWQLVIRRISRCGVVKFQLNGQLTTGRGCQGCMVAWRHLSSFLSCSCSCSNRGQQFTCGPYKARGGPN